MSKPDYACYLRDRAQLDAAGLLARGASEFSDQELLAFLLGGANAASDALALAGRLLEGGDAALLRRLTPRRLRTLAGLECGARLLAAIEIGRRAVRGATATALSSPRQVQAYARSYADAQKEHFLAIHLNTRHVPLCLEVVSVGTLSASLVHPREVFRRAVTEGCAHLVLVHNHPSGDPAPSPDDIEITARLVKVGELVGIEVLDHVILAGERYFSFREEGLVPGP